MALCILEVRAAPPDSPHFARADVLAARLAARLEQLRRKEEFDAKPLAERLVIRFDEGAETFDGETLTGSRVIEEVMKVGVTEGARLRVELVAAFKKRYGFIVTKSKALKKRRRQAGRLLIDALMHKLPGFRRLAIDCLEAMYAERHGYEPDAPEAERRRKQREWRRRQPR